jgi:hypothetical protein
MSHPSRLLVSFAYHDARNEARANLEYFLRVGVAPTAPKPLEVMHGFVVNGHNCSVDFPLRPDVVVLRRENRGYDFGQHLALLQHVAHLREVELRRQSKTLASIVTSVIGRSPPLRTSAHKEDGPELLALLDFVSAPMPTASNRHDRQRAARRRCTNSVRCKLRCARRLCVVTRRPTL